MGVRNVSKVVKWIKGEYVTAIDIKIGDTSEVHDHSVIKRSTIGERTKIWNFVNIFDSTIGDDNTIGSYVEIGNAKVGNNCKIESMVFIPKGVEIGNYTFIGPGVKFANDKFPKIAKDDEWSWTVGKVKVGNNVAIGINCTILPNVTIGDHAFIAAGSLVSSDVPPNSFAMGSPARIVSIKVLKELGVL